MFFLPQRGIILCDKCFHGANEPYVALPPGVLTAMRHIAYVDFEKLYNFSLPEDALKILNAATESYVVHTLHTVPKTLEFYKTFGLTEEIDPAKPGTKRKQEQNAERS